jgi:uncharacterized protein YlzI (FlbEa/FlbD family)
MRNFIKLKLVEGQTISINASMVASIEELASGSEVTISFTGKKYHVEDQASEVEKKIQKADKFNFTTY